MTGGRAARRKGNDFERELVADARASGLTAERAWGSNGRALGESEAVDVLVAGCRLQAKRRKRLAQWLRTPEGADAVAVREDRGDTLVVMAWREFLQLVERAGGW